MNNIFSIFVWEEIFCNEETFKEKRQNKKKNVKEKSKIKENIYISILKSMFTLTLRMLYWFQLLEVEPLALIIS